MRDRPCNLLPVRGLWFRVQGFFGLHNMPYSRITVPMKDHYRTAVKLQPSIINSSLPWLLEVGYSDFAEFFIKSTWTFYVPPLASYLNLKN